MLNIGQDTSGSFQKFDGFNEIYPSRGDENSVSFYFYSRDKKLLPYNYMKIKCFFIFS